MHYSPCFNDPGLIARLCSSMYILATSYPLISVDGSWDVTVAAIVGCALLCHSAGDVAPIGQLYPSTKV
jgi:hypothetical protein